jgi:hypothetical protein
MLADERQMLIDLHNRLAAFDQTSYSVLQQILPAVADIRPNVLTLVADEAQDAKDHAAILTAVQAAKAASVDVTALAGQLATALGPNLSKALVGALGAAITKGNS